MRWYYHTPCYGYFYRFVMRLAHRFNWHYAKPCEMHDGSVMRWCHWCGMRDVTGKPVKSIRANAAPPDKGRG